jgi:2,4-diketo-3-deoxy-L-fuconate hydrolase
MKLLRFGSAGQELSGVLDSDGRVRSLSEVMPDIGGAAVLPESISELQTLDIDKLPLVEGEPRIGPCVGDVGKFVCIGLNYSDHAAESDAAVRLHEGDIGNHWALRRCSTATGIQ